jgi:S1-C subfamily serine protease
MTSEEIVSLYHVEIIDDETFNHSIPFFIGDRDYIGKVNAVYKVHEKHVFRMILVNGETLYFEAKADMSDGKIINIHIFADMLIQERRRLKKFDLFSNICCFSALVLLSGYLFISFIFTQKTPVDYFLKLEERSFVKYNSVEKLYSNVSDAVVLIEVYNDSSMSVATGMIVRDDGYLISCDHIYREIPNPKFKVVLSNGESLPAVWVSADQESDICLLKIINTDKVFPTVKFADPNDIKIGEECVILGFPAGITVQPIATQGVVGATNIQIAGTNGYVNRYVQTDATANPGNSGGGLFSMDGRVLGIITSKYVASNYENTTYSIPSTTIIKVVNSLFYTGTVARPKLGISFQETSNIDIDNGLPYGCKIANVADDSPLNGKINVGDIIVSCNGINLSKAVSLYDVLYDPNTSLEAMNIKVYNTELKEYYEVLFKPDVRYSTHSFVR